MPRKSESITTAYATKYSPAMRNKSQKKAWQLWDDVDVLFLMGDAGVGKTFTAAALAMKEVFEGRAEEGVFLVRPAVEAAGEKIGYLPGGIGDKLGPYLSPVQKEIDKISVTYCVPKPQMVYLPIGFARGNNVDNAVLVVDESQNLTYEQFQLVLSRICKGTKCVITGSLTQCDIKESFLEHAVDALTKASPKIAVVEFDPSENMRHELVPVMQRALEKKKKELDAMRI